MKTACISHIKEHLSFGAGRPAVRMLAGLVVAFALAANSARAANLWWDGSSSGTANGTSVNTTTTALNWLSGGNWDNGSTIAALSSWTSGNNAIFGGSAASQTITAGTLTIGNMTFGQGAQGAGTSARPTPSPAAPSHCRRAAPSPSIRRRQFPPS